MPELSSRSSLSPETRDLFSDIDAQGAALWRSRRHLLDVNDLSREELSTCLALARRFKACGMTAGTPLPLLAAKTVANVFYENSTRTRSSFELAARQLGARVLNLDPSLSSVAKGETVADTALTLMELGVNAIVQRHPASGSAAQLAAALGNRVHVVNAGDGWHAHPTQALIDCLSMQEVRPSLGGAKVTIVGDIKHSRVARSNIALLSNLGVNLHVAGPPTLLPAELSKLGVTVHTRLEPALEGADFVMALRLQLERQTQGLIPSLGEYRRLYRIDHKRLKLATPAVRLLHPGPANRGVEVTDTLLDDPEISLVAKQVSNGLAVRMAVLCLILSDEVPV